MTSSKSNIIAGWGYFPLAQSHLAYPEAPEDLPELLKQANNSERAYRGLTARGLGRSYGDASIHDNGMVVNLTRLNHYIDFDRSTGILHCEAGVSLADIIQTFLPRGWFLPVTPGTKFVTVGGALASDVHGKNHHQDGSISQFVDGFELLLANGDTVYCSRQSHTDLFWATLGGMGLTGIILSAKIKLRAVESGWLDYKAKKAADLDELLALFESEDRHYQYSVAWLDVVADPKRLGRGVLMLGNHAPANALPLRLRGQALSVAQRHVWRLPWRPVNNFMQPWVISGLNRIYYARQQNTMRFEHYEPFFYPLDGIDGWNHVYGQPGFIQYQFVVPQNTARHTLLAVFAKIQAAKQASFISVLKKMGPASPSPIAFAMPGYTLTLDFAVTSGVLQLLNQLDELVLAAGGRIYLSKDARLTPTMLRAMQPSIAHWQAVKRQYDPTNMFVSDLAKRLELLA